METATQDFYVNPFDPEFRANPYPFYAPLLTGPPRLMTFFMPLALVARHADVLSVLRDSQRYSVHRPNLSGTKRLDAMDTMHQSMLFQDPPVHTRLRRLVSRDFTPRRIRELEPRIRAIANELLDRAGSKDQFDAIADLATPLPVMVIAEMLGLPPEHYPALKAWSDKLVELDNVIPGDTVPESIRDAAASLCDYMSKEIDRRRKSPGPDLISALVAHQEAEALTVDELLAFTLLLLVAGNETTTNLIGNGLLALARNPDQQKLLADEPRLMPRAIEEMLRYDSPVQLTQRLALSDLNIGGTEVKAGTALVTLIGAANRDPAKFPEPDRFDITRERNDHLSFGEGIHFCIGAPLARMEGAIAIASVLERFPEFRLAEPSAPLTYKGSFALRGLAKLALYGR